MSSDLQKADRRHLKGGLRPVNRFNCRPSSKGLPAQNLAFHILSLLSSDQQQEADSFTKHVSRTH
jgi:hypothetical protein